MINGSGFGTTPGQVNFVLNPGMTHQAAIIDWTDGQITAQVPDASGIPAYNGAVFVATCTPSNSVSFHFVPELETRVLSMTSANMTSYYGPCPSSAGNHQCGTNQDGSAWERIEAGFLSGTKGDTLFFQGFQLRNGWTVNGDPDFAVSPPSEAHSGARIASSYLGPSAPSVDVHWWVDAPNRVTQYTLAIWITGPKGVPYQ
jgi:hypothetical protein